MTIFYTLFTRQLIAKVTNLPPTTTVLFVIENVHNFGWSLNDVSPIITWKPMGYIQILILQQCFILIDTIFQQFILLLTNSFLHLIYLAYIGQLSESDSSSKCRCKCLLTAAGLLILFVGWSGESRCHRLGGHTMCEALEWIRPRDT